MSLKKIAILFILSTAMPMLADTVYSYTSPDFTAVSGLPFTTSDYVTGSFTVTSQLGSNFAFATIAPTSYSFSDGVGVLTNLDSDVLSFEAQTNAAGNIINWNIQLLSNPPGL